MKSTGGSASKGGDDIVSFINKKIREGWEANQLRPSAKATDAEWCRRAYLDLIGRIPTIAELDQFLKDNPAKRKENLIDRLLGEVPKNGAINDRYLEEFAGKRATIYTNLLIGRPVGNQNQIEHSREGMEQYLRRSFLENKPYDQLVQEIVSAEGASTPVWKATTARRTSTSSTSPGPIQTRPSPPRAQRRTSSVCKSNARSAQPSVQRLEADQFWSFNAFFRQTRKEGNRRGGNNGMQPEFELSNQKLHAKRQRSAKRRALLRVA